MPLLSPHSVSSGKTGITEFTAILFALTGFTSWVLGDSCIKWIGPMGLPPAEVVGFLGLFMALTLIVRAALQRNLSNLRPHSVIRQILRAMLDVGNNLFVVVALRHLSLTMFYILIFCAPMVVTLLSSLFLGEHITRKKVIALLLGFGGVVIAVAPWNHAQHIDLIGIGSCMICVLCFSTSMVWSRVLTRTETPDSLAFFSGIMTALCGAALTSLHPAPMTQPLLLWLMLASVFGAIGTLCYYTAVKYTSASNVSQYHYTQLLTGMLISFLVWHDKPGLSVLTGGALIIGSGILIAMAARQTGTAKTAPLQDESATPRIAN